MLFIFGQMLVAELVGVPAASAAVGWSAAPSLPASRSDHTATKLTDGRVLVTGGYVTTAGTPQFSATTAIYDPSAVAWTPSGSLSTPRIDHAATRLGDGTVIAAGGVSSGCAPIASVDRFNPTTGSWTPASTMLAPRAHPALVTLADGRALAVGGLSAGCNEPTASAEIFDPATGVWTVTGSLAQRRTGAEAVVLPDGRVFVAGGYDVASGNPPTLLTSSELFDPASGTWTSTGAMQTPHLAAPMTLLDDGRVLVAGGVTDLVAGATTGTVELYDPSTGSWSAVPSLATARSGHTATTMADGSVLVAGGVGNTSSVLAAAELFTPAGATGSWSSAGSMTSARWLHTATALDAGGVLVVGGRADTTSVSPLTSSEIFGQGGPPLAIDCTQSKLVDVTAPANVQLDKYVSNTQVRAFDELSEMTIGPAGVAVDVASPGTYTAFPLVTPTALPPGTVVNTHLVHADASGAATVVNKVGCKTYARDILGAAITESSLDPSDRYGAANTLYPAASLLPDRGLELANPRDGVAIDTDHRRLRLNLNYVQFMDEVRVFTAGTKAPSTLGLSTSTTASFAGQPVTITGTVASFSGIGPTPAGSVTFKRGATVLGTAPVIGGVATLTGPLPLGSGRLTAVYGGDTTYAGAMADGANLTTSRASTATLVTVTPTNSVFGQAVTVTATVSPVAPAAGTPTGKIQIIRNGTTYKTLNLVGGSASVVITNLGVGAWNFSAIYQGDPNYASSIGNNPHISVGKITSALSFTSRSNPSQVGQPVTFDLALAAVAPGSGIPPGRVTVKYGNNKKVSVTLTNGVGSVTIPGLVLGAQTLTATYAGNAKYFGVETSLVQQVNPAIVSTTTALSSTVNPSLVGQSVTFNATVSPVGSPTAPSGTLAYKEGATTLATVAVTGGVAVGYTTSTLTAGIHDITAEFIPNPGFGASTSAVLHQTVNRRPTTTVLTSSLNPAVLTQSSTFSATVTGTGGTPTGTVTWYAGGVLIPGAGASPVVGGVATKTMGLAIGDHDLTAVYSGDATFQGSTSSVLQQTWTYIDSATILESTPNPSTDGETVTLTAHMTPVAPGQGAPIGYVQWFDGATYLGFTSTVVDPGTNNLSRATFTISTLSVGVHSLTARYGGNSTHNGSTSAPVIHTVNPAVTLQVTAGWGYTCALLTDGTVQCWGYNGVGQLGDGTTVDRATPAPVVGLSNVAEISAGGGHTCALLTDGTVQCWGYNINGQLGDGTYNVRPTPAPVVGLSNVAEISVGGYHTCALLTDGTVQCWGYNINGQLGDGTYNVRPTPAPVVGLSNVAEISTGEYHTCALLTDGTVQCWGRDADGASVDRATPAPVVGLSNVAEISAGEYHTCGLLTDGTVQCWGSNNWGQLGDGTSVFRATPAPVVGLLSNVVEISAGGFHTCALLTDGTVQCWGYNISGQLGDGTYNVRGTPAPVVGLSNVAEISTGKYHTCALPTDGTVQCWGSNHQGELGDGTNVNRTVPTMVIGL